MAAPFTLTAEVAEQAAAFARMLAAGYTVPVEPGNRRTLADADLAARLGVAVSRELSLADWALVRLSATETLSAYQYGMLDAVEQILGRFLAAPAFHPQLADAIAAHRGVFAAQALAADGWVTNPQHAAHRLLGTFYSLACGWHPELGPAAEATRTQVAQWLARLAEPGSHWHEIADAAVHWLDGERQRTARLEKRVIDAESGALRARRARQLAARTLNQALAGRPLGSEVATVLRQDWFAAMQWVLLSEGEQGALWQRVKRTTGSLRWTLSPEIGDEARNQLYRVVAQVSEEITALAGLVVHDPAARERIIAAIDAEHLRVLRNEPRDTLPLAPVDAGDALADGSAALSEHLLARVRSLAPGTWLLWRDGNTTRRIRLLVSQEDTRQLLFVNALGARALACSWEAMALHLASGDAEALPAGDPLAECIAGVSAELLARQQRAQEDKLEMLRAARQQAATEARQREAARQKALAEAQALEAVRLEAQRRASEAQQQADLAARNAEQQRMQRARLMASSLTIGAWLAFRDGAGAIERRRLTVVLPSSGKYIFVDMDGNAKRELLRDELVRGLADGSISQLTRDQKLDDALTRVVDNLRHERGDGGHS